MRSEYYNDEQEYEDDFDDYNREYREEFFDRMDDYFDRPYVAEGWAQQDLIDMYRRER